MTKLTCIPDQCEVVDLSAAERATYVELFQLLMNKPINFNTAKNERNENGPAKLSTKAKKTTEAPQDRADRLEHMAACGRSPEEALLLAGSTSMAIVNAIRDQKISVTEICKAIVVEKQKNFCTTIEKLIKDATNVFELWVYHGDNNAEDIPHIHAFIRDVRENRFGDEIANQFIDRAMALAHAEAPSQASATQSASPAKDAKHKINMTLKAQKKEMWDKAGTLTNFSLSLVEHFRGIRFFAAISKYVEHGSLPRCAECKLVLDNPQDILLMGLCGHAYCGTCFAKGESERAITGECVTKGCGAAIPRHSAIPFSDFIRGNASTNGSYGSKVDAVVKLIEDVSRIPVQEHILVFVQFDRLKAELIKALNAARISFVNGSHKGKVDQFKKGEGGKVCILDIMSPDAAGW